MKRILLAAVALLPLVAVPVNADIIQADPLFIDLGTTGFGNAPRLLALQADQVESGLSRPVISTSGIVGTEVVGDIPITPISTPSLAALGWFTGANVGIGLDPFQNAHTGLTVLTLDLNLFDVVLAKNAVGLIDTFSLVTNWTSKKHSTRYLRSLIRAGPGAADQVRPRCRDIRHRPASRAIGNARMRCHHARVSSLQRWC